MHPAWLVGIGVLVGTAGLKVLKSKPAKQLYVDALVGGMQVRETASTLVDEAKAEFDDLMAEAEYARNGDDVPSDDVSSDKASSEEEPSTTSTATPKTATKHAAKK
ncbi:DUF6110 family protein [Slackia exigua]|uniref:DUF5132 domain-containing protein n=1 Tax=Slackia exigua (strain ATCC 700122 / DSM 15923 / CIP 105133 / JCM 11022 / KCTC 5966 / S-7) TaxID=649764 RepID=D0WFB8_SLAES|nr:DUF6110 family protein [Slackia exigua]EEZ61802.1 hypothetical protein HMPREF0762_00436 [Slackia exigua ATCC 700122]STN98793.1 Uncharacterised protein [Slackia exigua]